MARTIKYIKFKETVSYADIASEKVYDFELQHNGSIVIRENERYYDKLHVDAEKQELKAFVDEFVKSFKVELIYLGRNL